MAKFNVVGLESLERELARRVDLVDDAAPEMLKAGTDILVEYQRGSVILEGLYDTGSMLDSIRAGKIKKDEDGYLQEVRPHGVDRKGEDNARKGFFLNYGTSKIDATNWMEEANAAAKEEVVEAMRQVWNEHTERTDKDG